MGYYNNIAKCPWCGERLGYRVYESDTPHLPLEATCKCGYDYAAKVVVASGQVVEPQITPGRGERLYKPEEQTLGPPEGIAAEYIDKICEEIRSGVAAEHDRMMEEAAEADLDKMCREIAEMDAEREERDARFEY